MHGATEAEEQPPAGWVALVGAGPGDEGLLTVRAAELLRQAGLVVAGADLEPVARRYMSQDAQLTDPADGAGSARTLVQTARNGQLAVRLFNGDPLLSGAIGDAEACAKAGVRFEIVPGVPAATAVPAYAGIPLASERNGEVRIVHAAEASQLAYSPATLVVLGADAAPADLGKMLIAAGWPEATRIAITWDGTTSAQQTVVSTLGRVGPDLKAAGVSLANTKGSAIAVVGEAVAAKDRLSWFETKPLFGWRVLVPRTKEQAAVVSQRLREYGAVPGRGPDDRGRAAADAAADGARGQGPGHRPVPVGGLHLGERGARGAGTVRGVRPGRPGVRRREGRRRRRADGGVAARVRHPAGSGAGRETSRPRAWPRSGRRTTTCSTRSTGCCCRARTSRPRRCWRG